MDTLEFIAWGLLGVFYSAILWVDALIAKVFKK
jgi:hypothetical protein